MYIASILVVIDGVVQETSSGLEVRDNQGNVSYRYLVADRKTKKVVFEGPNRKSQLAARKDSISFLYGKKPDTPQAGSRSDIQGKKPDEPRAKE